MWAVLGLMLVDFLIGAFRSLVTKSFTHKLVLGYLSDLLHYVFPLLIIMTLMRLDPTGWILLVVYYISGLAIIWHYLAQIVNKWRA
jgi:hypothetical protein